MFQLQIDDIKSNLSWRWRLLDDSGTTLASHEVDLTADDLATTQVLHLYQSLWRLDPEQGWRARSAREVLDPVGDFVGTRLLGRIAEVLLAHTPVTVTVGVSSGAASIMAYPLEMARHGGASLSSSGVTWCYAPMLASRPSLIVSSAARMLAVFALPVDSSALSLVRERRQLERLHADLGAWDQLTVLQYGVTRAALTAALGNPAGWDVIHIAGHGVAGALYLEGSDGSADFVNSDDLVGLLAPVKRRARLIVLSACESGSARAARQGLGSRAGLAAAPSAELDNLGLRVATAVGSAVIAMRYPVDDLFSLAFARELYHGLAVDGANLDDAFRRARGAAVAASPHNSLATVTPMLITDEPTAQLVLAKSNAPTQPLVSIPGLPDEAPFFVGRTSALATVDQTLAADNPWGVMAIVGMPGLGKTALLVEATQLHRARFDRIIWHQLRSNDTVAALLESLGLPPTQSTSASVTAVRAQRVLIVIDDAHVGLTDEGRWCSKEFGDFVDAVGAPGGTARILFASERLLPLGHHVTQLALPPLSSSESELLIGQLIEHNGVSNAEAANAKVKQICAGHPRLLCDIYGGAPDQIASAALQLSQSWAVPTPLAPTTIAARRPPPAHHPGTAVATWTSARIAELDDGEQVLMALLGALEAPDRRLPVVEKLWLGISLLAFGLSRREAQAELDVRLAQLLASGLATAGARDSLVVHPAVASVGRASDCFVEDTTATAMATMLTGFLIDCEGKVTADDLANLAASVVPYLMRLGEWEQASTFAERASDLDRSTAMAERLSPYVSEIVAATAEAELGRKTRIVLATILCRIDHLSGVAALIELYGEAAPDGDTAVMVKAASEIADHLSLRSPVQAHQWIQKAIADHTKHPISPFISIMLRTKAAALVYELGADAQTTLDSAHRLAAEFHELMSAGEPAVGVDVLKVRNEFEHLITAASVRQAQTTTGLRPSIWSGFDDDPTTRSQLDAIEAQFNALSSGSGATVTGPIAEDVLAAILAVFRTPGDVAKRGLVLGQLAEVRWRAGSLADATSLTRRALRADYSAVACLQAARDHRQLARLLASAGVFDSAAYHVLATAIIYVRLSEGRFIVAPDPRITTALWAVKMLIARTPEAIPTSYAALRDHLLAETGTDLEVLLAGSPRVLEPIDAATGQFRIEFQGIDPKGSLSDVVELASVNPAPAELNDPRLCDQYWGDITDLVAEAAHGRAEADPTLGMIAAAGWHGLGDALRRVAAGDFEPPLGQLEAVDELIVAKTLAKANPDAQA